LYARGDESWDPQTSSLRPTDPSPWAIGSRLRSRDPSGSRSHGPSIRPVRFEFLSAKTRSSQQTDSTRTTHGSAPAARAIDVRGPRDRDRPSPRPAFSGPAIGLLLRCGSPPPTVGLAYCDDGIALHQLPEPEDSREHPHERAASSPSKRSWAFKRSAMARLGTPHDVQTRQDDRSRCKRRELPTI